MSSSPPRSGISAARVVAIDHFGSYNCRHIYGRDAGNWSEHATADAVDIAGFRLADGTRISVARDWKGDGPKAAFLREVRDGACRLFATTLSPDYNAAHRDHLHLDQADARRVARVRDSASRLSSVRQRPPRYRPFRPNTGRRPAGGSTSPTRSPRLR